jgi:acyl-CoA synthetase (NDP forming)
MAEMEARVVARAREGGIRVFGPNCMGLYVPGAKLSFNEEFPKEAGNIGFLSQSGGNAVEMVYSAAARGLRFSKLVSYGNAADVNANELLAYLAGDPETGIICAYVEGVPHGREFFAAIRDAARAKPVIVLKGGRTEAGTRAVMSHTASLAGSIEVFDALCRQVNAIRVNSVDEMVDVATAFRFLGRPSGPAVALVAAGGGFSVFAADEVDEAGLKCPVLPEAAQVSLRELNPAAGTSIRNPVDSLAIFEPGGLEKTLRIVGAAENVDVLIPHVSVGWGGGRRAMAGSPMPEPEVFIKALVAQITSAHDAVGKPVAVVVRPALSLEGMERTLLFEAECARVGLPVFPTISRCARAIAKLLSWQSEDAVRGAA